MTSLQTSADPYRYRVEDAVAELRQAVEFDLGDRDYTFGGDCPPADLERRRHGAVMGCVRNALRTFLRPVPFSTVQPTLADLKWLHTYKACGEQCPFCSNGERDQ